MCGAGAEVIVAENVISSSKSRQQIPTGGGVGAVTRRNMGGSTFGRGRKLHARSVCEIRELSAEDHGPFSIFMFPCRELFS